MVLIADKHKTEGRAVFSQGLCQDRPILDRPLRRSSKIVKSNAVAKKRNNDGRFVSCECPIQLQGLDPVIDPSRKDDMVIAEFKVVVVLDLN
jgi:hypothetical protein